MAENGLEWLEMDGNIWKWIEKPDMAKYGLKQLEWNKMAENG